MVGVLGCVILVLWLLRRVVSKLARLLWLGLLVVALGYLICIEIVLRVLVLPDEVVVVSRLLVLPRCGVLHSVRRWMILGLVGVR